MARVSTLESKPGTKNSIEIVSLWSVTMNVVSFAVAVFSFKYFYEAH